LELTPDLFFGDGGEVWLSADLTSRLRPSASYLGQGNDTRLSDEAEHRETLFGLDIDAMHRIGTSDLYAGATQSFEWRRVDRLDPEGLLALTRPNGVEGGLLSGLGPVAVYDSRSSNHSPLRGSFVRLAAPFHTRFLGSDYEFARFDLDAIHFFQLSGEHVLAVRGRWQSVLGTAPFYRMAELGGATLLRGYLRGRFVDRHAVAFEVEYRFPIYWRFGGVAFVGVGQVAPAPIDFAFDRFHAAAGLGLRFALVPEERLKLRLDVAASPDAVRPYFSPEEAF
jgi:outer membrane protein assembly factor BamA